MQMQANIGLADYSVEVKSAAFVITTAGMVYWAENALEINTN